MCFVWARASPFDRSLLRVYIRVRAAREHTYTYRLSRPLVCLLARVHANTCCACTYSYRLFRPLVCLLARVQMLHTYAVEFCPPVLCLRARACTYKVSRPLVHSLLLRPLPISAAYDRVYSLSLSCSSSPLWRVSAVVGGVYSVQWLFGREKIIASDMVIPSDWSRGDLMRLQLTAKRTKYTQPNNNEHNCCAKLFPTQTHSASEGSSNRVLD